jgi:hypothetical protein
MAFRAKYLSDEYLSKQIATLRKALESVSTKLSIAALLGLALVPVIPKYAAPHPHLCGLHPPLRGCTRGARSSSPEHPDRGGARQGRAGA